MGSTRLSRHPRDPRAFDAATLGLSRWQRPISNALLLGVAGVWIVGFLGFLARTVSGAYEIVDFHSYFTAAQAVVHGQSPYPGLTDVSLTANVAYVYPPLTAIGAVPFTLLPVGPAGAVAVSALAGAVVATLRVLGVRDWRCYVLALCWRPVLFAILTGNLTIVLGLAAAIAWRFRDSVLPATWSVGLTLAAKIFLWPLVVWLAATRRYAAAVLSCVIGVVLLVGSWAVIGFTGLADYPDVLGRAQALQEGSTYTINALALDLGASPSLARATGVGLVVALLAGIAVLGHRGDDRGAFLLAIAAAIAFSPIVWLHYFALLTVVVAIAQPRLGPLWLLPLAMWVAPGVDGSPAQKALVLVVGAIVVLLAVRAQPFRGEVRTSSTEPVHGRPSGSPA